MHFVWVVAVLDKCSLREIYEKKTYVKSTAMSLDPYADNLDTLTVVFVHRILAHVENYFSSFLFIMDTCLVLNCSRPHVTNVNKIKFITLRSTVLPATEFNFEGNSCNRTRGCQDRN